MYSPAKGCATAKHCGLHSWATSKKFLLYVQKCYCLPISFNFLTQVVLKIAADVVPILRALESFYVFKKNLFQDLFLELCLKYNFCSHIITIIIITRMKKYTQLSQFMEVNFLNNIFS